MKKFFMENRRIIIRKVAENNTISDGSCYAFFQSIGHEICDMNIP